MNENLLQFIWQFQYFNKNNLSTTEGIPLLILQQGQHNLNQGPDFKEAKIKIGGTIWAGNIELHINASDWFLHHHEKDKNYANIILHVVWNNDKAVPDKHENPLPTLELKSHVSKIMLQHYEQLMFTKGFVACESFLPLLSRVGWLSWKERLVAERLQRKAAIVLDNLQQANNHWEEVFWWLLARNFGMKVNADAFEQMAKSITVNILAKHKNQLNQLEAILLGQSGLLGGAFKEDYPNLLQREYQFIAKKHHLKPVHKAPDFLRMRPASFPTIRLAQLAALVQQSTHLFSKVLETKNLNALRQLLNVTANDYWHYHYQFDELLGYKPKNLGHAMTDNIIINTIVPVLFAYGLAHNAQQWKELAILHLSQLSAEQNNITKAWKQLGIPNDNALDSQALLELKNNYCNQKLCLQCAVGNKLLKE